MKDNNSIQSQECFVGNIIGKHIWGVDKVIRNGTKHFRPGAKVYIVFMYGGMGNQHVRVLGKPRKSFRMIDVAIRTSYIKNFRLQKVCDPRVLAFLKKYPYYPLLTMSGTKEFIDILNNSCSIEITEG